MEVVPAIAYTLRLIGFTLGASLDIFLLVTLLRRWRTALAQGLTASVLALLALWHAGSAAVMFRRLNADVEWSFPSWASVISPLWIGLALAAATLSLYAAARGRRSCERRFFIAFAAALVAAPITGAIAGSGSTVTVLASLAPPLTFAWFVYRYNLLDLLIPRRVLFALKLGAFFAVYLFLIREVATYVEEAYGAHGPLLEIALVFAAGLVWLPLYGWMTRSLSKRTQLYAGFSKRLIEEAARILDLRERLKFIAAELERTFNLRRVLLVASDDPAAPPEIGRLAQDHRVDVICVSRGPDSPVRRLIGSLGFTYYFPLWYEERLVGHLLVDTSPQMLLDENEDILLGLSRQISNSIETCRLIEDKIRLERAFADQEHMANLGKAAATIAHEIKNPLSSIKALTQLMREEAETRERHGRDLGYIIDEADRLNRAVQQLLSFSRPLQEQPPQEVDLSRLLENLAQSLARQYDCDRIRITHGIQPGLKLNRGDPEIVRQIVLNLLLNAVQASETGGEVRLEAALTDRQRVSVAVSDNGSGIPADIRDRIFEPFFTTKQRGTGLGLAIVRKSVLHVGGTVEVRSPTGEGRGTRVEVTLPAG
jgi:signal transduction histidine kinase